MVNCPKRRSGDAKLKGLSESVGHQRGDIQIRKEPSLRSVVRMADIVAGHDFLVGQFTNARHVRDPFLATGAGSGHGTAQPAMSLGGIAASVKQELAVKCGNVWPTAKAIDAQDGVSWGKGLVGSAMQPQHRSAVPESRMPAIVSSANLSSSPLTCGLNIVADGSISCPIRRIRP